VAKRLGCPKAELQELEKRALNYRNVFNKDYNLMCGRNADGTFEKDFSPLKWGGNFTEGNSWHYTWSVFHDVQGLIDLMGGKHLFVEMLDSVFAVPPHYDDSYYGFPIHEIREMTVMNMGNYAHGNQPAQHMIYLYNYAGEPWKTQARIRKVMDEMYTPAPDGYCGDEDNGQTSAWYVFSALGFYPVCPASDEYVLGAPLFKHATIHLENGRAIVIDAPMNSKENMYIGKMLLNGNEYTCNYLKHSTLVEGAKVDIDMVQQPCKERGIQPEDAPYSFSTAK
jgi:predicted alpha-1,2-mannosidase